MDWTLHISHILNPLGMWGDTFYKNFFGGESLHQLGYFETLATLLNLIKYDNAKDEHFSKVHAKKG